MRVSISGISVSLRPHVIQLGDAIEHAPAGGFIDAGRVGQIQHRIAAGAETHSLMIGRQKPATPQSREQRLVYIQRIGLRDEHHERRQILVFAAQAVTHPGAHTGSSGLLRAGLDKGDGGVVIDRVRVHRPYEADVVGDLALVRQELAEPLAAFTMLVELEDGRQPRGASSVRKSCP